MSDFSEFLTLVKGGAAKLAVGELEGFAKQTQTDAADFVKRSQQKFIDWTKQLKAGDLSREDFEFLVKSQADLAEMNALTEAGKGAAALQRFRDGLINLVVDSAVKVFLP